ncbi:hypothetical protein GJ496_007389 [Pomphorhynchus laevis]|nr:hypothetical protein GJ496_007389 [Pomphorhynchus laevis]
MDFFQRLFNWSSGKSTFVNYISSGEFSEDTIPTIGFNVRRVVKGNVQIKFWDVGGQPRFRAMWERYCHGVNAIIFMVDAADHEKIETAKTELFDLLSKPRLAGIPLLVLGNKKDIPGSLTADELSEKLDLQSIQNREVVCYSISCKERLNIDTTLRWLMDHSQP